MDLHDIKLVQSDDLVKSDLEMTCLRCGSHLCDVEADDDLGVLVSVATDHLKACARK